MLKSLFFSMTLAVASQGFVATAFAGDDMTHGVVRKLNLDDGKITIKHGEIKNLDMPPMSMIFNVKDASIIDALAKGDKVKFVAAEEGGKLFITEIQSDN
jgi:Cu/Ag efflux protein CusF